MATAPVYVSSEKILHEQKRNKAGECGSTVAGKEAPQLLLADKPVLQR
jgi:hypothetical protein